jgi:hypothetical protein
MPRGFACIALVLLAVVSAVQARGRDDGYVGGTFAYTYQGKKDSAPKSYGPSPQAACAALLRDLDPPQTLKQADPADADGDVHCAGKHKDGSDGFDQYQNGVKYVLICPADTEEEAPSDERPRSSPLRCKCKDDKCPRIAGGDAAPGANSPAAKGGATAAGAAAATGAVAGAAAAGGPDTRSGPSDEEKARRRCQPRPTARLDFTLLVAAVPPAPAAPSRVSHRPTPDNIAASVGSAPAQIEFERHVAADVATSFGAAVPAPRQRDALPLDAQGNFAWPAALTLLSEPTLSLRPGTPTSGQAGETRRPDLLVLGPGRGSWVEIIEATLDAGFTMRAEPGTGPRGFGYKQLQIPATAQAAAQIFQGAPILYTIRSPRMPSGAAIQSINGAARESAKRRLNVKYLWVCG